MSNLNANAIVVNTVSTRTEAGVLSGMRLTRRGRFVFFALPLFLLLVVAISVGIFSMSPAQASGAQERGLQTVTVYSGESLWEVAQRTSPAEDPRSVVNQIVKINDLKTFVLEPGQQLEVPLYR